MTDTLKTRGGARPGAGRKRTRKSPHERPGWRQIRVRVATYARLSELQTERGLDSFEEAVAYALDALRGAS